jgi:lipoprotein-anchoring transpeptidase ErfK/SrfK
LSVRIALFAVLALSAVAPASALGATPATLPAGATIARVDVSGLDQAGAKAKVQQTLAPVWERPVTVRIGTTDQQVATADLGFAIDYDGMVTQAFDAASHNKAIHIKLKKTISSKVLSQAIARLGKPFYRAPRDARVKLGVRKIVRIHGRYGRGIVPERLRQKLIDELRKPTTTRLVATNVYRLRPKVRVKQLARKYATYISVDRANFKLRLFKRLRLVKTYPIAVGQAGLETPAGIRHVLDKQVNPTWHVPNSPWAGSLAGQVIPPSDPRDPLKARLLDLGDGFAIHGTAEDWSIGTAASHGCIRMHVSDVIDLYPRVPVGTPVLIH